MSSILCHRRPRRVLGTVDLSRFNTLPTEIQLLIWKYAAEETRIINLDISIWTAICEKQTTAEFVVFGGQITPQKTTPLVLPASSQRFLKTLSLTCRGAREAVLKAYPDTIRVQGVERHERPLRQFLGSGDQGIWHLPDRPLGRRGRSRLLRCNFARDHFYFRRTAVGHGLTQDGLKFAHLVYHHYLSRGVSEITKIDEFRTMLRSIKNLILPLSDTDTHMIDDETRDLHLKTVLSSTTNLENLYICPHGTHFREKDMPIFKHDLPFDAWDGELWCDDMAFFTPSSILYELSNVRDKYTQMHHRYLDPVCYDFKAGDIANAGDTATDIATEMTEQMGPPHEAHWMSTFEAHWMSTFEGLVKSLGFTDQVRETKTQEVRDGDADDQDERISLPQPGYIMMEDEASG